MTKQAPLLVVAFLLAMLIPGPLKADPTATAVLLKWRIQGMWHGKTLELSPQVASALGDAATFTSGQPGQPDLEVRANTVSSNRSPNDTYRSDLEITVGKDRFRYDVETTTDVPSEFLVTSGANFLRVNLTVSPAPK